MDPRFAENIEGAQVLVDQNIGGALPLCSPCSYALVYRVFHRTHKFCSDKLDLQTHLHTQIPVVSFDPTVVLYSISTLISGPKECGNIYE